MFRFKKRWRRLPDGNSYSEKRWNNDGWRRFWSFSLYWTSWAKTASDRSLNEPTPAGRLCSPMLTSLPWMSFTSLSGLRGTTTWGVFALCAASDNKLVVPTLTFTLWCHFQVDRPIRTGVAPLVGAAGRPGQGRGRNNLYGFLAPEVIVPVLVCLWFGTFSLLQTSPWRKLCTRCCAAVTLTERRLIRTEHARRRSNRRSRLPWLSPRTGRSHQNLVQTTSTKRLCWFGIALCVLLYCLSFISRRNS